MRVYRSDLTNRLDANGNSVLQDGDSVRAELDVDPKTGRLRSAICRCRGDACECGTGKRTDGAATRDDAVSRYAQAIVETEVIGRNMWQAREDVEPEPQRRAAPSTDPADAAFERYISALEGR